MRRSLFRQAISLGLFVSSSVLAALLFSSDARAQEPKQSGAPKRHTLPLSDSDRKVLAAIGWPKPLPPLPPPHDALYARDGQVITGTVTFLEAFATVKQGASKKDIPRDKVGLVLIAAKAFPKKFGQLPNNDDAVLLDSGEIISGHVNVDGAGVHVKARTFSKKDVTLIRLKGPPDTIYPDIEEPPDSGEKGPSPPPGKKPGETGSGKQPQPARGHGPEEIAWGKALWRGFIHYRGSYSDPAYPSESVTYQVTWKEEISSGPAPPVRRIELKIIDLRYTGSFTCDDKTFTLSGSGFDQDASSPSRVTLFVKEWGGQAAGWYHFFLNPPKKIQPCRSPDANFPGTVAGVGGGGPSRCEFGFFDFDSDRAPAPYTTLSSSVSGSVFPGGKCEGDFKFVRGAPPINIEPDPCSVCTTVRGRLQLENDTIKSLLAEVKKLNDKIGEAKTELDQLNRVKASMHDYMNLLLVAAASEDVAHRLLEMIVSDGATQIGGALDEESEYGLKLKGFVECLLATAPVIKGFIDHNPDYLDYVKGLPRAASRRGCTLMRRDVKIEDMESDSLGDLISAATEEFELGKILADAIGLGTGEAEAEYIQEHLDELGPLVPEDALQHVEQYLKLTEQSTEKLKELEDLSIKVARDSFALADHGVAAKALEDRAGKCPGGC